MRWSRGGKQFIVGTYTVINYNELSTNWISRLPHHDRSADGNVHRSHNSTAANKTDQARIEHKEMFHVLSQFSELHTVF